MGKLYRETKKEQGGDRGNQYTVPKGNNFPLPTTAEKIGEKIGREIDDMKAHRRG